MSNQSINQLAFNIIYKHSLNKEKSYGDFGCAYRGVNDTRCFVGALIKDEYYVKYLEGFNVLNEDVQEAVKLSLKGLPNIQLLVEAQEIHDLNTRQVWDTKLKELAKEYSLTVPTI